MVLSVLLAARLTGGVLYLLRFRYKWSELQGVALLGWLVRQRAQLVWVLLGLERYLQARRGAVRLVAQWLRVWWV